MIVLDLAGVPIRDARRISLASWYRLRSAVEKTTTALVVIGEELNARSCSAFQVENRPLAFEVSGKLLKGLKVETTLGPRSHTKTGVTLKPRYRE
jgi:hypothetical protein